MKRVRSGKSISPKPKSNLSLAEIKRLLYYDKNKGAFRWRVNSVRTQRYLGKTMGHRRRDGYYACEIRGHKLLVHRLVWLWEHGEWPKGHLDHVDGNPGNNHISNLRLANKSQNGCNRGPQRNNKSGIKGVSWHGQCSKWRASIYLNLRQRHLGLFDRKEDAAAAYRKAAKRLHGKFGRLD
jgi:hypothetical protein